jgi:hypothetical protein
MDALDQAVAHTLKQKGGMENNVSDCFLRVKMAARFLANKSNFDPGQDSEFLEQQRQLLKDAVKKLIDQEQRMKEWESAMGAFKGNAGGSSLGASDSTTDLVMGVE